MQKPVWAHSLSILLKVWRLSNRCKTANWNNRAEYFEVKWLGESWIVSVPTEFNESDFDKPIIFVSLTMAHVTVPSLALLSVRLVWKMTAASTPISDRLEQPAYSPTLRPGCLEFRGFHRTRTKSIKVAELPGRKRLCVCVCGGTGTGTRGTVRHFTSRGASISCGIWTAAGSGSAAALCPVQMWGRPARAQGHCPARPCCLCNMTNSFLKIGLFVRVWAPLMMHPQAIPSQEWSVFRFPGTDWFIVRQGFRNSKEKCKWRRRKRRFRGHHLVCCFCCTTRHSSGR